MKDDHKITAREKTIIRTSVIGILANVLLAAFKTAVGLVSHSIAIVLDAVNNLSDAGSSVITIIGTKLAGKPADRKHPFGHGRVEYLSAMVISVLILYAGFTSLVESVKKIIDPVKPDYTPTTLIIVAAAVIVKVLLGRYVKGVGMKVNSSSLVNSGTDAMMDSVISASTLVAAIVYIYAGLSLEAWLGVIISAFIIKAGIDMLRETYSQILGERVDPELINDIKKTVTSFPDVNGAYDLILHNYGPDSYSGSVHVEVPDTYSASDIDVLSRKIAGKVYQDHHVIMTAIGVYSTNTRDDDAAMVEEEVRRIVFAHDHVLQMHGFFLDKEAKTIRFDVIISFDEKDRVEKFQQITAEVQERFPDYAIMPVLDADFSES